MSSRKKESLSEAMIVIVMILFVLILVDYVIYNSIWIPSREAGVFVGVLTNILMKFNAAGFWKIRLLYMVAFSGMIYLVPRIRFRKEVDDDKKKYYWIAYVLTSIFVCIGYFEDFYIYNLIIYPTILFVNVPLTSKAISLIGKTIKEESVFGAMSNKESDFSFKFGTDKGQLTIHSPNQNIWIDGGPGSGKSQSLIKPIIQQAGFAGYAGIIYDFEGDPRESGAPVLGRIGYTSVLEGKKKGINGNLNFSFINFNDLTKSVRVNPLSQRYINDRLDVQDLIQNLMANLSVNKDKGADFWEKYGTAYIYGITWFLFKNYKDKCTIPHVVCIALNSIDTVLRWASQDRDTSMILAPLISAWKNNATGQLAGAETSGQLPISILLDPNIFWVMSADEFDLDITNKEKPKLLCIGNSKKQQQALAPAISAIITVIMKKMNSAGKVPSVFCFDEFPTVKVNGVDTFIATARKHKVATILALQDFEQAIRDYGEKAANILRTSCGNQFYGMTGNLKTAEYISNSLGEIKRENISFSTSAGGDSQSMSESLQREKVIQTRDIMGQSIGHFTGKIAGGEPPWFSAQFDEFKYDDIEIPSFNEVFMKIANTGNKELDKEIIKNVVQDNYDKIITEAEEILAPYVKQTEE